MQYAAEEVVANALTSPVSEHQYTTDLCYVPRGLLTYAVHSRFRVERIGKASPSRQELSSLRGKNAFLFFRADKRSPVIGSREKESCVLRIFLESANNGPLPLCDVPSVRCICLSNEVLFELKVAVVEQSPSQWTVVALIDPSTLQSMANESRSSSDEKMKKSDFSFELRVAAILVDSNQMVELCRGRVSWRIIGRMTPMVSQLCRRVEVGIYTRLSQSLRNMTPTTFRRKIQGYGKALEFEYSTEEEHHIA